MSFLLARRGLDVTGVDSSPQAVHDAREQAAKRRFKGAFQARRANAEQLPWQDGEFDAVVAYHSLHHVGDVERVLREMLRVCRTGGRILISEFHEQGQKTCEHEVDGGRLLRTTEEFLQQRTRSVRRLRSLLNVMFVCEK
jgi:ubiquinone/menaquinone biosynthesis C-methylase UbiE